MNGRSVAIFAIVVGGAIIYSDSPGPLHNSRLYMHETAAIKAIQTLNTAQIQYKSQYERFARSLSELAAPAAGPDNASGASLISSELAAGETHGYRFTLEGTATGYKISAVPTAFGSSCSRPFYSDQSLAIREHYGHEPATASSQEVGSTAAKSGGTM